MNKTKRNTVFTIVASLIICLSFVWAAIPASAQCLEKIIGGADSFTNGSVGSVDDDLIICESGNEHIFDVVGKEGDDVLLIYVSGIGGPYSIIGDLATDAGDDVIKVLDDAEVGSIQGDNIQVGGQGGNDDITLDGLASTVSGDYIVGSSQVDVGGNDRIDILGVAENFVMGDAIYSTNSFKDIGGDDAITVHQNASARVVTGDRLWSTSTNSTGGNDLITVAGTVLEEVRGDGISAGTGGNDTILITETGKVGTSGTAASVYGDYESDSVPTGATTGGDDTIIISGTVYGRVIGDHANTGGNDTIIITETGRVGTTGIGNYVYGDFVKPGETSTVGGNDSILVQGNMYGSIIGDYMDNGGDDTIVVDRTGVVHGLIYGDRLTSESGTNGKDTITVLGTVLLIVRGDGFSGHGADDVITIETSGYVERGIVGDGVSNIADDVNGGDDIIVVKGVSGDDVAGDLVDGNGANDTITILGKVTADVIGDDADGNAGKDAIVIQGGTALSNNFGMVEGMVIGDRVGGNSLGDNIVLTRYSQVLGGVYGDNNSYTGGNGGNDNIQIDGRIGKSGAPADLVGDKTAGNGGNDFLHVETNGLVYGSVIGDDVNGSGGQDLIWIDGQVNKTVIGDKALGGNAKDTIAVRQGGLVKQSVIGDGTNNAKNGGWDSMNITGGQVNQDFIGDDVNGNGGNDFMAIRMGGLVKRDFIGDDAKKDGGNDTLSLINGTVEGDMIGDKVDGNGGDDKLTVLVAGTVNGDVIGDIVGVNKLGGNDSIFVAGKVGGKIYGDHASKNALAGADNIQTSPSAVIGNGIIGDNAKGAGANDNFKINGVITTGGIKGDLVNGKGGNDNISVFSLGDVTGNVIGDDANGAGGNDTILVDGGGKVTGHVWGDFSMGNGGNDKITVEGTVTGNVEGDRHKTGSSANGGDDIIIVEEGGLVQGNVFGDNSPGNGGDDRIDIKGKVNGNVLGDNAGGAGGNDVIRIFDTGVVVGSVCGRNFCNNNAGDNVVFLDESATPSFDSADTIIIAGKVLGNVIAGTFYGSNSDDQIVVIEGAEIGGTVYAGDETEGDSFIYVENIINEEKTISEVVNSVQEQDGKVTVNGATYTLDNVENVVGAVGQIACFGMDYRMNKASDGCAARSQSEKDAIQWHLDNPGNDGRLPGLESCAVYAYGNALRIYEIMDGAQGELVAEIWGDVLSNAPATNELLGATSDGNIALYHLASGELQVECRNLVDGKTQVRVLGDLAGSVTNAYDKS